ncbi:MAG: hypothetical protein COS92_07880, partial [Desulfobacterales bacterium CG07_land_8_20_14_0_80_52_14]
VSAFQILYLLFALSQDIFIFFRLLVHLFYRFVLVRLVEIVELIFPSRVHHERLLHFAVYHFQFKK